jgi:hypothetical protein
MNKEQQELLDEVYGRYWNSIETSEYDGFGPTSIKFPTLMKEQFVERIKTDDKFSEKWGLTIEERELSLEERCELGYKYVDSFEWDMLMGGGREGDEGNCNDYKIPTKLITTTYNNEIIESYE